MIDVRLTTEGDWPVLREIRLAALLDSPDAYASLHAQEVDLPEDTWRERATASGHFLAWEGGQPVGMAVGLPPRDEPPTDRLLVAMWVAPSHRGRGIAGRLAQAVATWARSDGGTQLVLDVVTTNASARAAYLKVGFRPTGRVQPVPGDGPYRLEEQMALSLAPAS